MYLLRGWDSLTMAFTGKFVYICIYTNFDRQQDKLTTKNSHNF